MGESAAQLNSALGVHGGRMKRTIVGIMLMVSVSFFANALTFELLSYSKLYFDAGLAYIHEDYVIDAGATGELVLLQNIVSGRTLYLNLRDRRVWDQYPPGPDRRRTQIQVKRIAVDSSSGVALFAVRSLELFADNELHRLLYMFGQRHCLDLSKAPEKDYVRGNAHGIYGSFGDYIVLEEVPPRSGHNTLVDYDTYRDESWNYFDLDTVDMLRSKHIELVDYLLRDGLFAIYVYEEGPGAAYIAKLRSLRKPEFFVLPSFFLLEKIIDSATYVGLDKSRPIPEQYRVDGVPEYLVVAIDSMGNIVQMFGDLYASIGCIDIDRDGNRVLISGQEILTNKSRYGTFVFGYK